MLRKQVSTKLRVAFLCLVLAVPVPVPFWAPAAANAQTASVGQVSQAAGVQEFLDLWKRQGRELRDIRRGAAVPRIFIDTLPDDLPEVEAGSLRKAAFIKILLPILLDINEQVLADRELLLYLAARHRAGVALDRGERRWLEHLAAEYGVGPRDFDALIARVDVVPPSLALAQGAEESGWGTSRFARHGNAVYGQRTWQKGAGMVPVRRDADASHEVRTFGSLQDSVYRYVLNLNTHPAYEEFREERARVRAESEAVTGGVLAATLLSYSERGEDYVATLEKIIDGNRLEDFDDARLARERSARLFGTVK
ncbi:glucosaminidase domain-containing protein [Oceanibacterium hippocampi]|nr:glucosaminidase domain-containing protein [Oceanibacterium hippocampi]